QEAYYAASPYNFVRLILGKKEAGDNGHQNVYTRAARWLDEWIQQGVLVPERQPAIYPYFQDYTVPGTKERRLRKSFIALGRLEDYGARIVHRHELTHTGPKKDRLELLRHTRAHFGQLFMIYSDPQGEIDKMLESVVRAQKPIDVRDSYDAAHRLWTLTDTKTIARVQELMAEKKLIIADGHHRYETALAYRNECREKAGKSDPEAPWEKAMMTFVNMDGPGVTVLPTHRVVHSLKEFSFEAFRERVSEWFDWYAYPVDAGQSRAGASPRLLRDLADRGAQRVSFGVAPAGEQALYLFLLKPNADLAKLLPDVSASQRKLDLVVLHRLLLERGLGVDQEAVRELRNVRYAREVEDALGQVDRGEAQMVFLVNATRVEQVREVALGGETLPQKSTDFYPKMLSGLTLYRLERP
ncbi:MAG: DUF1015 domain-containing protein, partial [Terriglobia bacterium]